MGTAATITMVIMASRTIGTMEKTAIIVIGIIIAIIIPIMAIKVITIPMGIMGKTAISEVDLTETVVVVVEVIAARAVVVASTTITTEITTTIIMATITDLIITVAPIRIMVIIE